MRRLLHCNSCSFLTWLQADLQTGYAYFIIERMSWLFSSTKFLMDKPVLLLRRGQEEPVLSCLLFYHVGMCRPGQLCIKRRPDDRTDSTLCNGSREKWTGLDFWMRIAALTKNTAVLIDKLMTIL
jgi:hypothetical protein